MLRLRNKKKKKNYVKTNSVHRWALVLLILSLFNLKINSMNELVKSPDSGDKWLIKHRFFWQKYMLLFEKFNG